MTKKKINTLLIFSTLIQIFPMSIAFLIYFCNHYDIGIYLKLIISILSVELLIDILKITNKNLLKLLFYPKITTIISGIIIFVCLISGVIDNQEIYIKIFYIWITIVGIEKMMYTYLLYKKKNDSYPIVLVSSIFLIAISLFGVFGIFFSKVKIRTSLSIIIFVYSAFNTLCILMILKKYEILIKKNNK